MEIQDFEDEDEDENEDEDEDDCNKTFKNYCEVAFEAERARGFRPRPALAPGPVGH